MARKALLIGAQTGGLTGVDNDVKSMADALTQRGFAVTRCEAENASRVGILDAYERLITDAGPDDAVFVYYSGHGGFYQPPDYATVVRPRAALQYIVPFDFDESPDGDFRGITSIELSLLLRRLTDKTRNATVAFDCCHAGHISRDGRRPRGLDRPTPYDRIASHLDMLRRQGLQFDQWMPLGNPYAVRLVACAPDEPAFEYPNDSGVTTGMFTEALTQTLAEAGSLPITWATAMDRIRRRVLTLAGQRPEAEGPARRLLFDVVEADPVATLPAVGIGTDRVRLDGAALLGVQVGDEFVVMPADSPDLDHATKIGDVRVDKLDAISGLGTLRLAETSSAVPLGARAHYTRATAPAMPVRLPDADSRAADLIAAVMANARLRPAEPNEHCPIEVVLDESGGLTVCDEKGPLHAARPADANGVRQVVADLGRLAHAAALRCLTGDSRFRLDVPLTVEFGLVEAGDSKPLARSDAVVFVDQRIYVRVRNEGTQTVYVSLFDIGVLAQVTMLTNFAPAGVQLDAGKEYVFGWNDFEGTYVGAQLSWPGDLDTGQAQQARQETILVVATSAPQDLGVLTQEGIRARKAIGPRSPLEQLFDQMAVGGTRDVLVDDSATPVRYAVYGIDFDLAPARPPRAEDVPFQVDDRPAPALRLLSGRQPPARLAVRLSDLVVHHNRALRLADIRLDTVAMTRGVDGEPVFRAQTERFHDIRDGQRLPLDHLMIYHGPAIDYLDLAVWVSRDSSGSLNLADLLQAKLGQAEIHQALGGIGALIGAAPQVMVAAAALGASAVIVNAAYHLLREAVGDSIGLYRTTFLAHERFGVGRRPGQNLVRAQDFSFGYLIEDVH